jgi:hypothetical protein
VGWATGRNNNGREIGYAIEAVCDLPGCDNKIDLGLSYCCGGLHGVDNGGMDDEQYCGDYFCAEHLYYRPDRRDPDEATIQVCERCKDKPHQDWPEHDDLLAPEPTVEDKAQMNRIVRRHRERRAKAGSWRSCGEPPPI